MSIDNIQLTDYILEGMYSKCLVNTKEAADNPTSILVAGKKKSAKKAIINSLGENEKKIMFLVNNENNKFLADDEMKLLSDLLTACKISMADIALVNYHQHPEVDYLFLSEHFQSKKILAFGVSTTELDLPFTIPFFQIQKFQEQVYMTSPPLGDFMANVELKKQLWNSLKKIFLS